MDHAGLQLRKHHLQNHSKPKERKTKAGPVVETKIVRYIRLCRYLFSLTTCSDLRAFASFAALKLEDLASKGVSRGWLVSQAICRCKGP